MAKLLVLVLSLFWCVQVAVAGEITYERRAPNLLERAFTVAQGIPDLLEQPFRIAQSTPAPNT